jgi:hypothetical protein
VEIETKATTGKVEVATSGTTTERPAKSVQVPACGRIVHYVLPWRADLRPTAAGAHRPAMMIEPWGDGPDAVCCLNVFLRGQNDKEDFKGELLYVGSVPHDSETKKPGTWHWPEYVPPVIREIEDTSNG